MGESTSSPIGEAPVVVSPERFTMASNAGLVFVDHDHFALGRADADTMNVVAKGTLLESGPGFVGVYTGISYGPARVTVDVLGAPPGHSQVERWEVVEETEITSPEPLVVMTLDGTPVTDLGSIPPGSYTIRCHAVGRDTHTGLEVTEPTESYLFQLWPSPYPEQEAVRTLRKTDDAWSQASPPQDAAAKIPEPDFNYVFTRAADGAVRKVDRHSAEADEVREWINEYGGRPLPRNLAATTYAKYIAALDRDLLDRIATQDEDSQLRFARFCAQRALEKANLNNVPWLRELVNKMNLELLSKDDIIDTKQRLDNDPAITLRLTTGLPSKSEVVQQYQAVLALEVTTLEESPLLIAVWAYYHALQTFGMKYPDLLEAANQAFPPD